MIRCRRQHLASGYIIQMAAAQCSTWPVNIFAQWLLMTQHLASEDNNEMAAAENQQNISAWTMHKAAFGHWIH